jgi:hypothetical protein
MNQTSPWRTSEDPEGTHWRRHVDSHEAREALRLSILSHLQRVLLARQRVRGRAHNNGDNMELLDLLAVNPSLYDCE